LKNCANRWPDRLEIFLLLYDILNSSSCSRMYTKINRAEKDLKKGLRKGKYLLLVKASAATKVSCLIVIYKNRKLKVNLLLFASFSVSAVSVYIPAPDPCSPSYPTFLLIKKISLATFPLPLPLPFPFTFPVRTFRVIRCGRRQFWGMSSTWSTVGATQFTTEIESESESRVLKFEIP